MIKIRVKKYEVLFKLFTLKDILNFLKEISYQSKKVYVINESLLTNNLIYQNETSLVKTRKKNEDFSENTFKILNIISKLRDEIYLKEILRFLEYQVYLNLESNVEVNNEENCGIIIKQDGKKINCSLSNYLNQLQVQIEKNLEV